MIRTHNSVRDDKVKGNHRNGDFQLEKRRGGGGGGGVARNFKRDSVSVDSARDEKITTGTVNARSTNIESRRRHKTKYTHERTHARTHTSTHAHKHARTHARTHTHIHTHTHARATQTNKKTSVLA